jgi:hypothetical protein
MGPSAFPVSMNAGLTRAYKVGELKQAFSGGGVVAEVWSKDR